jgi:tetratricopeptide (TPR) repeat protein
LRVRHEKASVPHAVAICGLGGTGKSQLALKYAEDKKEQYNPILWIDATDEEAVRSSFERCAAELGLAVDRAEKQASAVVNAAALQIVLRWLHDRIEADDEWLVIIDNADDLSWGIKKIIPKGERGSILITSRDNRSPMLLPRGCELIQVGPMSPLEGAALLLHHLSWDADSAPETIQQRCSEVAEKLGYLPLAIDLAGAYIGNDPVPEQALTQYLADYDTHRDELLQMDNFRGLLQTEKTVWTVWDTTLERITNDYGLQPGLLLTFLAYFKGNIIQDEMFRLASLGMTAVDGELDDEAGEGIPTELRKFVTLDRSKWDSFLYRQSCDVLLRYSLLQRVDGEWAGVTMHSLVQWRAVQGDRSRPWGWWYTVLMLAACFQFIEEQSQPEFRRHLMMHFPDASAVYAKGDKDKRYEIFIGVTLGRVYYDEGRWEEAEKLFVQVMETRKTKLGADHPLTLTSIANLASTYKNQGRWEEAERLFVQVMEILKIKLGVDHPSTLTSMGNLALTYRNQGRWEAAEKLEAQVMETSKTKLGADHPDTLRGMGNLAFTWNSQGRHSDALALMKECVHAQQRVFGKEHPYTLSSLATLEEWSS